MSPPAQPRTVAADNDDSNQSRKRAQFFPQTRAAGDQSAAKTPANRAPGVEQASIIRDEHAQAGHSGIAASSRCEESLTPDRGPPGCCTSVEKTEAGRDG